MAKKSRGKTMNATTYAQKGWAVLPLKSKSKQPAKFLKHGYLDATTNLEQIDNWFTDSDLNIGLGIIQSGLVVFDFDERNVTDRKAWIKIMAICEQQNTYTVHTNNGWHYYFKADASTQFKGKIIDGIDIKHKGYVVLPPSIHPSGTMYKVANDVEPVELPDELRQISTWC